jgi:hypothetical protein
MEMMMPATNSPDAASEFSERDLLVALLDAVATLAARLGGGTLVIPVHSSSTGRVVKVHADGAAFAATPEQSIPVRAALAARS